LFPVGLVLGLKLLVAWGVYALATQGNSSFATFWMSEWGIRPNPDWPFLFHGWDSAWYMRIAKTGYSYPAYAFFPAYPLLIRAVSGATGEYLISSFAVSFVLGLIAIPLFQLLAEHYVTREEGVTMTLLFALFPPVFFFTSVAYTESLFTVAILGTWVLCLRKRYLPATVFAAIATLTKVYGLLIALPLATRLFDEKKRSMAFLALFVPSMTFVVWNGYLFSLTGDWTAYWSSQNHWREGWPLGINSIVRFLLELMSKTSGGTPVATQAAYVITTWLLIIVLFGALAVAAIDVDRDFGTYGAVLFLFIVTFGNVWSFSRFLPFILPVWLNARVKSKFIMLIAILVFPIISLVMWHQFVVLGVWFG